MTPIDCLSLAQGLDSLNKLFKKGEAVMSEQFKQMGSSNYFISDQGRVFNKHLNRFISGTTGINGTLYFNENRKTKLRICLIVANLFIDKPDNAYDVEHINGNRSDNRAINLRWKVPTPPKEKPQPETIAHDEEFIEVTEFPEYAVSNYGRVWSYKTGRIMTQRNQGRGYLDTKMSNENKSRQVLIHRLVAIAFIPNPENKSQVNHKDKNKLNNHISNLEWMTDQENKTHAKNLRHI